MRTLAVWQTALAFAAVLATFAPAATGHAKPAWAEALLAGASTPGEGERGRVVRRHNAAMAARWQKFEATVGRPLGSWAQEVLEQPDGDVFYPFSGPDFGTVHRIYPGAKRYVLIGLEPAGRPPRTDCAPERLDALLGVYRKGLATFVKKGFFGTREMRRTFERKRLVEGITGVLMLFASHEGFEVRDIQAIRVADSGRLELGGDWTSVRISLRGNGRDVVLDYLQLDLSDNALERSPGHVQFVKGTSRATVFLKAASHLMQNRGFDIVREAILDGATTILQDETGIGYERLAARFEVRLFGDYRRAHHLFGNRQTALKDAYQAARPSPLPFKIGYWKVAGSCLQYGHARRP